MYNVGIAIIFYFKGVTMMKWIIGKAVEYPELTIALISGLFALISAVISARANKRLKRTEARLQQEIDKASSLNDQLTYVKNARFDYEFDIYKDLSKKTILLTSAMNSFFFQCFRKAYSEKEADRKYAENELVYVSQCYHEFRDALFMSAPFIPEPLFKEFESYRSTCQAQFNRFSNAKYYEEEFRIREGEESAGKYDAMITQKQDQLIISLRKYLEEYRLKNG